MEGNSVKINQAKGSRLSKLSVASVNLMWERSGSVVECLTRDVRGRVGEPHRRHCVVSLSKNINPRLVLVQPRKTRPFITERLLMGRKESNKQTFHRIFSCADPKDSFLCYKTIRPP